METPPPSLLLTLPPELLALIPQYLPYQSTLRLLATCHYLRPLLSSAELVTLRRQDPDEIHRMEIATFQSLKAREDWGRWSRWDEPRFGVEEVVCYTCLRWLNREDRNIYFHPRELFFTYGKPVPALRRRRCIPCQTTAGVYGPGREVSSYWRTCLECGVLAWKGPNKWARKPDGAKWILGGKFCNGCTGEDEERLEELRQKYNPKYGRGIPWRRWEVSLMGSEAVTRQRMIGQRRRDGEQDSAWGLVGVARLFAGEN